MKAHTLSITVYVPENVSNTTVRRYVEDALRAHGGAFPKDDPLFPANWDSGRIRVRHQKEESE